MLLYLIKVQEQLGKRQGDSMPDIVITIEGAGQAKEAIRIPEALIPVVKDAFMLAIPLKDIPDPNWVDPGDGSTVPMLPPHGPLKHFILCMQDWFWMNVARGVQQSQSEEVKTTLAQLKADGAFALDK